MRVLTLLAVAGVSWVIIIGGANVASNVVGGAGSSAGIFYWSALTGVQAPLKP